MRLRKGMTWTPSKPSFVVTSDIRCSIGLYNFIFLRNRIKILSPHRSSCPEVFCKKSVLKNFAKFWEITKNTFFIEHLRWLLLSPISPMKILYIWCIARFGTICTIFKNVKNTHGRLLILVKLQLFHGCFSPF